VQGRRLPNDLKRGWSIAVALVVALGVAGVALAGPAAAALDHPIFKGGA